MDKTHGHEVRENDCSYLSNNREFNILLVKELENWARSMYLIPEEFEYQKRKIYKKVTEKVIEQSGW